MRFRLPVAQIRSEIQYAWRGPSVLVVDNSGRAGDEHTLSGFFFRETRYLRTLRLEIDDDEPFPCSVAEVAQNRLEFSAIYPPVQSRGGGGTGSGGSGRTHDLLYRTLDFRVVFVVHPGSFEVQLRIGNRWNEPAEFDLAWILSADYAGLSEAQAGERQQNAAVETTARPNAVHFRYAHEELPFETHVSAAGTGEWSYADGRFATRLTLERQQIAEMQLTVRAIDSQDPLDEKAESIREKQVHGWHERVTRLFAVAETPLVELTNQAMDDLGSMALLDGEADEWLSPAAGMPMYPATFGRDALTAAWQSAAFDRGEQVGATLAKLRRIQGTTVDDRRDEQPGRIIQQARNEPLARLNENPLSRYYGDYASPFMFILALGQMYAWAGDRKAVEDNWDAARRILDWAREHGDIDGDGYLEYQTRSEDGPKHQGWKDSDNAIVDADGRQVDPPIAVCEIQGYWFASLQFMAVLSVVMGEEANALDLWKEAHDLKERFNRDFWLEDEGYVALGLDAEKRPIKSLTSNAGQCLTTGIVNAENLPRLVRRIFQPDLFSGWGLRTLTTDNPSYNPLSYHLGSVWPVENGTILFGLRRFGFDDRALELARALYDLARLWPAGRSPECVGGYARSELQHPGAYPRANTPQAWNQSTVAIVVQAILGMRAVAPLNLLAVDPVLPPWLPELTVKKLRVGGATVSLHFWRDENGKSHHRVLEQEGELHIVRQPPVNSLSAGMWDRLGALAEGGLPFG